MNNKLTDRQRAENFLKDLGVQSNEKLIERVVDAMLLFTAQELLVNKGVYLTVDECKRIQKRAEELRSQSVYET